jgi:hypothetical protein
VSVTKGKAKCASLGIELLPEGDVTKPCPTTTPAQFPYMEYPSHFPLSEMYGKISKKRGAAHLVHRQSGLHALGCGVEPGRHAEKVRGLLLLAYCILGINPRVFCLALLDRLPGHKGNIITSAVGDLQFAKQCRASQKHCPE